MLALVLAAALVATLPGGAGQAAAPEPPAAVKPTTLWLTLPPASRCSFDRIAAAVVAQTPALRVRPGAHPLSDGEVLAALTREDGGLWLSLRGLGAGELRRPLPPEAACVELAQTSAFIVNRYVTDLSRAPAEVEVALPVPPPVPPPAPPPRWEGVAGLGLQAQLNEAGLVPAVEVSGGLRRGPWEVDAAVGVALPGRFVALSDETYRDTFQVETVTFDVPAGRRFRVGRAQLRLDFSPGVELHWTSDLSFPPRGAPAFTAQGAVGARIGLELPFPVGTHDCLLAVRLGGRLLLGPRPGSEGSDDHDADDPPPYGADGGLSLAFSYFL